MNIPLPSFLRREKPAGYPLGKTREQRLKEEKRRKALIKLGKLTIVLWILLSSITTIFTIVNFIQTHEFRSPIVEKKILSPIPTATPKPEPTDEPEATESSEPKRSSFHVVPQVQASESMPVSEALYRGKVSHYSHAGCLGCSENQTMGNGQPFDENAMTLAVPCEDITGGRIKYNTKVLVKNLDNGKSTQATITDCGGFSKYNRIADLSLGMATLLGTKTDQSNVEITLL